MEEYDGVDQFSRGATVNTKRRTQWIGLDDQVKTKHKLLSVLAETAKPP